MSVPSGGRSRPIESARPTFRFPRSARILRRADFRRVYEQGIRVSTPYFVAFCALSEEGGGGRIGLTVPRMLGKAVIRNRIKRRLREAVRLQLRRLPPGWDVVINARQAVVQARFEELLQAVERLFARCATGGRQ